ncbi:MAG: hypothetical protein AMS18_03865 [Gemmatimonas sp. SG8_17]|nr:MAG: hypothetical protein AMS18_03865 [Gemmatimonas sp. SG8_17]
MLSNGTVVTGLVHPTIIPSGAVAWTGDRIVAVGPARQLRGEIPAAHVVDARGGVIMPGLVNLHHHFYSALARALDPGTAVGDFVQVLDRLWWRLDRALDRDAIRVSAQLSVADCIRWGCTTVFDHHSSPSSRAGSLALIAEVVEQAGLSTVLCYEVSDRNGHDEALAGIDENLGFIADHQDHPRVRGVLGLHASFTLRDETLVEVAKRRASGSGCHIHVAEDRVDVAESRLAFGKGPVERLDSFGLLDHRSLLAHGIHLESEDYDTIARHDAVVVHNPESNANNGVGQLDTARVGAHGCLVGLGTDGMSSSMLRAARAAFLAHRMALRSPGAGFEVIPQLLSNNVNVARRFYDEPELGVLLPGAPADIIVVDAPPPTPLLAENLFSHLIYGAAEAPVRHTVARGRFLLEDFAHTTMDSEAIALHARELTPALWRRFSQLPWGTRFIGA